jgi:hypothetical protein
VRRACLLLAMLLAASPAWAVTRLWFPVSSTPDITPTLQGTWDSSGGDNGKPNTTKGSSAITTGSQNTNLVTANSTSLHRIWLSAPLSGAQTISGTITGQIMARELAATDDLDRVSLGAFVVSGDGVTLRGTLLAVGNYGLTAEYINNATLRNKVIADGDAVSSVNALDGDRIQFEMGSTVDSTGGSSPVSAFKWGENATDLPAGDEAQTSDGAGWIELSVTLTLQAPAAGAPKRRMVVLD